MYFKHEESESNEYMKRKKRKQQHIDEQEPVEVRLTKLNHTLERIAQDMERTRMAEYVELLNKPMSLIWRNIVAGTARGVGIAIGFTFFAATILYVLQILGALNLPIIGDYIADIVRIVQIQLEGKAY